MVFDFPPCIINYHTPAMAYALKKALFLCRGPDVATCQNERRLAIDKENVATQEIDQRYIKT